MNLYAAFPYIQRHGFPNHRMSYHSKLVNNSSYDTNTPVSQHFGQRDLLATGENNEHLNAARNVLSNSLESACTSEHLRFLTVPERMKSRNAAVGGEMQQFASERTKSRSAIIGEKIQQVDESSKMVSGTVPTNGWSFHRNNSVQCAPYQKLPNEDVPEKAVNVTWTSGDQELEGTELDSPLKQEKKLVKSDSAVAALKAKRQREEEIDDEVDFISYIERTFVVLSLMLWLNVA